jgi:hypothetical protein
MNSDLEQRLREALHRDAARARLVNPNRPATSDTRSVPGAQRRTRSSKGRVAAAAVIALIAAVGAGVWFMNARDRDVGVITTPDPAASSTTTTEPATPTSEPGDARFIDTVEGAREFRVDDVVVTVQCVDKRTSHEASLARRELILGGVVTANPGGVAMVDDVNVAVGDRLALIIREDHPDGHRDTLYHPSIWYGDQASEHTGSCIELVVSVPSSLDGGFFSTGTFRLEIG